MASNLNVSNYVRSKWTKADLNPIVLLIVVDAVRLPRKPTFEWKYAPIILKSPVASTIKMPLDFNASEAWLRDVIRGL
jgi:hypothetical protein